MMGLQEAESERDGSHSAMSRHQGDGGHLPTHQKSNYLVP